MRPKPAATTFRVVLTPRGDGFLAHPDEVKWHYARGGASSPLWACCSQRWVTLTVKGLARKDQAINLRTHIECPLCGFVYHLSVRSANGRRGGHIIEKLDYVKLWTKWLEGNPGRAAAQRKKAA
jgi:hypothetical protein